MSEPSEGEVRRAASDLEEAAAQCTAVHEIDAALGYSRRDLEALGSSERELIVGLAAAFQYDSRHGPSDRNRPPFVPMFTLSDGTEIPPAPENVPEPMARAWASIVDSITHPAALSRLADLLFCRRWQPVGEYAERAVRAYLSLSRLPGWQALDKADGLLRALELSKMTRKDQLREALLARVQELASEALDASEGPGVALPLLEELARNPTTRNRARSELERAASVYHDPHTVDHILTLLRSYSRNEEERQRLSVARVEAWRAAADSSNNVMIRMSFLEDARRLADDYGLTSYSDEITVELQKINREELGLTRIQSAFEISRDEHDAYVSQFIQFPTLAQAVDALTLHPPLTGPIEETREAVERMEVDAPLSSVLPKVKLGGDGLPRWRASNDEQKEDEKLADHETIRLQIAAPLFADGLEAIGRAYIVSENELREHLRRRSSLSSHIADGLTESLLLFWRDDYNLSALAGVWLIEAAARELLLQADQAIYISQREQRVGQYPGLGTLLRELQRLGLDTSWFRYFWTVFASPAGMNLRNEIAHGFVGSLNKVHAAIVIHGLNYISALSAGAGES